MVMATTTMPTIDDTIMLVILVVVVVIVSGISNDGGDWWCFSHTYAPEIHFVVVVPVGEETFGRAVPAECATSAQGTSKTSLG
jgi:hypothetical protein